MKRVLKKRKLGRPPGTHYRETIPVRLTVEAAQAIDAWAAAQNEHGISRSEAIRRLMDSALDDPGKLDARTVREVQEAIVALERALAALRRVVR
jgi:hypothetical protein